MNIKLTPADEAKLARLKKNLVTVEQRSKSVPNIVIPDIAFENIEVDLDLVDPNTIYINKEIQRAVDPVHLKKIIDHFDPALLGCVVLVRYPDGTLASCDGQHRTLAARFMGVNIPAVIFNTVRKDGTVDWQLEAKVFQGINKNAKKLNKYELYRVGLILEEKEAVAISKILKASGVSIIAPRTVMKDGEANRIDQIIFGLRLDGTGDLMTWALKIILRVWPKGGVNTDMAYHLALFRSKNPMCETDPVTGIADGNTGLWSESQMIEALEELRDTNNFKTSEQAAAEIDKHFGDTYTWKGGSKDRFWGINYFADLLDPEGTNPDLYRSEHITKRNARVPGGLDADAISALMNNPAVMAKLFAALTETK